MNIDFKIIVTLLMISAILLIYRYWNNPSRLRFYDDPDLMEQEVLRLIPLGSSVANAEKIMTNNGFKCSPKEKRSFVRENEEIANPREEFDYLYCDIEKLAGILVFRRWQINIFHENSKVNQVSVSIGLTGL